MKSTAWIVVDFPGEPRASVGPFPSSLEADKFGHASGWTAWAVIELMYPPGYDQLAAAIDRVGNLVDQGLGTESDADELSFIAERLSSNIDGSDVEEP